MNFSEYTQYLVRSIESVRTDEIESLVSLLADARERGAMVFVIGNGGSAANASHFAQDLAKGTLSNPEQVKRLKALSLTDNLPFFSALGNDEGYENVFVQQLRTYAGEGDILIAISGSGNSPNILKAVKYAKEHGLTSVGITGFNGGRLLELADHSVHVPLDDMCTSESIHSILFHYVIIKLQERFSEVTENQASD